MRAWCAEKCDEQCASPPAPLTKGEGDAPIVKRKSCLASNEAIQVQVLVGVLENERENVS